MVSEMNTYSGIQAELSGTIASQLPYTLTYLREALQCDEQELMTLASALQVEPHTEPDTQQAAFTYREAQVLRKAMELYRRGESLKAIQGFFGNEISPKPAPMTPIEGRELPVHERLSQNATVLRSGGKTNLAVVVDAIANARNDILRDVTRLMDDKLAGLDEVIVELIRCKAENDVLRQKVTTLEEENTHLEDELHQYKPTGFGFYRKVSD